MPGKNPRRSRWSAGLREEVPCGGSFERRAWGSRLGRSIRPELWPLQGQNWETVGRRWGVCVCGSQVSCSISEGFCPGLPLRVRAAAMGAPLSCCGKSAPSRKALAGGDCPGHPPQFCSICKPESSFSGVRTRVLLPHPHKEL